mmetsp:Transcript_44578/g.105669  ORF Transcript_44578/g.105669 Transcript_44578/m.105669 type:complete len:493 (+) Transcript_44578:86-1564(+)
MRFGKKLALQVTGDESGAPYISHKPMKEAINKTVRELRTYQSKCQQREQMLQYGMMPTDGEVTAEELVDLETRISALDEQLFDLVDKDLKSILRHIRETEASLDNQIGEMQEACVKCGLIIQEQKVEELEKALPFAPEHRARLCECLLELQLQCRPVEMSQDLEAILSQYKVLVESMNQHIQYLEINVAGFRKLLKRHEKQIPRQFHARDTPYLGFHRLVTRTSRQLLEVVRQLGKLIGHTRGKLLDGISQDTLRCSAEASAELFEKWQKDDSLQVDAVELKPLGAECQMVLEIQKQLKAKSHIGLAANFGSSIPGILYPKPAAPATSSKAVKAPEAEGSSDSGAGETWSVRPMAPLPHQQQSARQQRGRAQPQQQQQQPQSQQQQQRQSKQAQRQQPGKLVAQQESVSSSKQPELPNSHGVVGNMKSGFWWGGTNEASLWPQVYMTPVMAVDSEAGAPLPSQVCYMGPQMGVVGKTGVVGGQGMYEPQVHV